MTNELLKRAKQEGTPLIDGDQVAFVWHGQRAPQLIGDLNDWEPGSALELAELEPGLWAHSLSVPRDAYVEYAYLRGGQRVPDPLNPRTTPDGLGHLNHFFYMPEAAPTGLTRRRRGIAAGKLTRCVVEAESLVVGDKRGVYLYQPPSPEPCPLLVVLDGQDYVRRGKLPVLVDNLIAQGRIGPIALALVAHAGPSRLVEYACNDSTLAFIVQRVLPLACQKLKLVDLRAAPGAYGILGASMGGLLALYAALRAPHIFGYVLSQSGAFPSQERESVIWDLVRHGPPAPLKIWMDVGRFEWLLRPNRRMRALLGGRGYDVTYREYNAGHNYTAWRNDIWRGLETMFRPGELA